MKIHHGGPSKAQSFWAVLDEKGGRVDITFDDGKTSVIQYSGDRGPIDAIYPSVDGDVLCCFLRGSGERFFATATGQALVRKTGRKKTTGPVYRPEFYV